jgi:hypothetical protein
MTIFQKTCPTCVIAGCVQEEEEEEVPPEEETEDEEPSPPKEEPDLMNLETPKKADVCTFRTLLTDLILSAVTSRARLVSRPVCGVVDTMYTWHSDAFPHTLHK